MPYVHIVIVLALAEFFYFSLEVARARKRYKVAAPATTGNEIFERYFRVHMNTLEWMPTFLVPLWLCAVYLSDVTAAALGLVWIVGRAMYFTGYRSAVEKRLPGFFIQAMACLLLLIGAAVGIVMHFFR